MILVLSFVFFSLSSRSQITNCVKDIVGGRFSFIPLGVSYCWPDCDSLVFRLNLYLYVEEPFIYPDFVIMKMFDKDGRLPVDIRLQPVQDVWYVPVYLDCSGIVYQVRKVVWYATTYDLAPNVNGYYCSCQVGCD